MNKKHNQELNAVKAMNFYHDTAIKGGIYNWTKFII